MPFAYNDLSGVVTGGVVQANTIGEVTLGPSPPPPQIPRQLPPAPNNFVNRSAELTRLSQLFAGQSDSGRPSVTVVSGVGGVGKTAIGLHWAQAHRERFNDGQLYADLSAYRYRGGVEISDVLGSFLRALGVHEHYIPAALAERAALFRTHTASMCLLILVDDVDQAAQVRPLLPGSANCAVIVTSRRRLSGLLMDGAELVELRPLDSADGASLVAGMVPEHRLSGQQPALRQLVTLCAGLPIALRVAGARLALRHTWSVTHLVEYLSDDRRRLDRLSLEGEHTVQNVLNVGYRDLPAQARKLYRVLGLHPGPDFGSPVVAAAGQLTPESADDSLEMLAEASLVEDLGQDRYRLHDLIRLHARQTAEREWKPATRERVLSRIAEWYLTGAVAADRAVLGPARWRLGRLVGTEWTGVAFTAASAMDWFSNERMNLLAVLRTAAALRWDDIVWQLCEALWAFYHSRKHYADWIEAHELGIESAVRLGDRVVEARMYNQLARAYLELADFDRAGAELDKAMAAARASDEPRAQAVVLESFGVLRREEGRYADAIARFRESRAINETLRDQRGIALQSYHLGDALLRSGQAAEALGELAGARHIAGRLGDDMTDARIRIVLGSVYQALDRDAEARHELGSAVATMRERRQPIKEAQALEVLVAVARRHHDDTLFGNSVRRLLELYDETGSPRATVVRRWIEGGARPDDV
jgi:tetratricopeptide (TPR) repeat protein